MNWQSYGAKDARDSENYDLLGFESPKKVFPNLIIFFFF